MCGSASRRWRWGLRSACRSRILARNRARAARRAAWRRQHRADRAGTGAAGAVLSAAAGAGGAVAVMVRRRLFRLRLPAGGAGARALFMLPVLRNTITGLQGVDPALLEAAQGVGMTPAAVLVHGRAAAGAAGDDGGHPHRGRVGDRHRDAVDADRPDQPRQLHLCRTADPELGVRAVRLPRRRGAGAGGRPVAGADRERLAQPQPRCGPRSAASASPRWSRPRWCRRWRARRRPISSAQRPLPSNMCCRR